MPKHFHIEIPDHASLSGSQIKKIASDHNLYIWELVVRAVEEYANCHQPVISITSSVPELEQTNHK